MGQINVKAAAVLDARPEDVYATIADYQHGHPNILPKENLYDLQVERGGYGAGTIIRFKAKVLGVEQSFYQRVSEPEPGRVLVEQDIDSVQNVMTTFTVTPVEQEQRSHVEISTTMNTSPGFKGFIERIVVPIINPRVYRKELKLLEAVAQKRVYPQGDGSTTPSV
jgi:Polyketide cyclase / dehydrase and lipid transport